MLFVIVVFVVVGTAVVVLVVVAIAVVMGLVVMVVMMMMMTVVVMMLTLIVIGGVLPIAQGEHWLQLPLGRIRTGQPSRGIGLGGVSIVRGERKRRTARQPGPSMLRT
jgi:hypothetical protein